MNELQAFFELAESYVRQCYEEDFEQDLKDDVVDLLEEVLHYGVLLLMLQMRGLIPSLEHYVNSQL